MKRVLRFPLQSMVAVLVVLALAVPAAPAMAQTTTGTTGAENTIQIMIDAPPAGVTVRNGSRVLIGGWAVDPAGPGVGIDMVRVYLDGQMDAGGTLLGSATTGGPRPDVASALGNPAFRDSGFDFFWTPTNVSAGSHTLYVYARSSASSSWAYKSITVEVEGPPTGRPGEVGPGYGPDYGPGYGPMRPGRRMFGRHGEGMYYPDDLISRRIERMRRYAPPPPLPPPLLPILPIHPPVSLLPGPATVTPAAVTGATVTLVWTPVPGAVSYRVLQGTAGGAFVPANLSNITPVSATVTGLMPLTTYQFQVVAVDAFGMQGQPSATVTVTTTIGP